MIRQRKLYLDPLMDMYNSEILLYKTSEKPNAVAVMEELEEAIQITEDCLYHQTFPSDQGWAYQLKAFKETQDLSEYVPKGQLLR